MSISIVRDHKVITGLGVLGVCSAIHFANPDTRQKYAEITHGYLRSVDFACTVTRILFDYKFYFRNVECGTPEYDKVYHDVNHKEAERVLQLCRRLGGYYVKAGQMIASFEQGVPKEWVDVLSQCQDKAEPVPFRSVSRVFREDLKVDPYSIFREIEEEPIGCASLAQVHRATLLNGQEVAVKVQYPFIRRFTLIDLRDCELATKVIKWLFPSFEFTWFVPRFRENVIEEIDFTHEIANMKRCRAFFSSTPTIYVPEVFEEYSSPRICMMEYIQGVKVNHKEEIQSMGIAPRRVAQLCVEAFSAMMFRAPFLHVDPHPGNLLVRFQPGSTLPQLVVLDHGMYNYMDDPFRAFFQELWLAMVAQDQKRVEELCGEYGLEKYSQLLTLSLTGRSLNSRNLFGEEMGDTNWDSIEDRITTALKSMNKEAFSRRITVVSQMMQAMPADLMYIVRVIEMMKGLLRYLDGKESDRLSIMTRSAVIGKYGSSSSWQFFRSIKWKVYLYFLRFRLWCNNLYLYFYFRLYCREGYTMEFDPDIVFESLIQK